MNFRLRGLFAYLADLTQSRVPLVSGEELVLLCQFVDGIDNWRVIWFRRWFRFIILLCFKYCFKFFVLWSRFFRLQFHGLRFGIVLSPVSNNWQILAADAELVTFVKSRLEFRVLHEVCRSLEAISHLRAQSTWVFPSSYPKLIPELLVWLFRTFLPSFLFLWFLDLL